MVFFSNVRVVGSSPPTYKITVSSHNRKQVREIKFSSQDLDKQSVVKRKVRENLQINPVLPKSFDGFVHQLLQHARIEEGPFDASEEENICYWIREWFKTAVEAEDPDDLTRGYLDREGAYWFVSERINGYLSDRTKVKLTSPMLWSVINDRGGRKSKVFSLAGKKVRLWGLDKDFFEEHEPAEAETITKPTPEMLAVGETELPVPDDEVPEMVIPQVQEEKVSQEAAAEAKTKRKAPAKAQPSQASKEEKPPSGDPEATQDEKREIVQALRAQGKTDEQVRDTFYEVTGKKGSWHRSDIEKLRQSLGKEEKSPEDEATDFLKELES
ncbi:hypothetical protein ES703_126047 [subsurface metagenome]